MLTVANGGGSDVVVGEVTVGSDVSVVVVVVVVCYIEGMEW